jgi:hypothetical protein
MVCEIAGVINGGVRCGKAIGHGEVELGWLWLMELGTAIGVWLQVRFGWGYGGHGGVVRRGAAAKVWLRCWRNGWGLWRIKGLLWDCVLLGIEVGVLRWRESSRIE